MPADPKTVFRSAATAGALVAAVLCAAAPVVAQDVVAQDVVAQDVVAQDVAAQDVAAQDVAAQDVAAQNAETQDAAGQGAIGQGAMGATSAATTVELNRLEDAGGGCRLTLVVANPGSERFQSLKLDLVLFDTAGVVARRLAVETGPVRANKTVVRLFEAADLACSGIGRLLLNDVVACDGEAGPLTGCVDRLQTASRTAVPFER